uniref:Uncharacterized protein n=1 Tax=Piliocolobus tephrosceles TaxID=591936 RepID=A0A8C9HR48_9PRIM
IRPPGAGADDTAALPAIRKGAGSCLPEQSGSTDSSYTCTKEHDFKMLWPNAYKMPLSKIHKNILQKC